MYTYNNFTTAKLYDIQYMYQALSLILQFVSLVAKSQSIPYFMAKKIPSVAFICHNSSLVINLTENVIFFYCYRNYMYASLQYSHSIFLKDLISLYSEDRIKHDD